MVVTVKQGKRNPYDSGGPLTLDLTNYIDVVAPEQDIPFLRTIGWGATAQEAIASKGMSSLEKKCISVKHSWLNDTLVPSSGTITASHTAAGATITVGATAVLYFKTDDIVRVHSTAAGVTTVLADVFYLIGTVGATTLNVTPINADADLANGDSWYLMGNSKVVGSDAGTQGVTTVLVQTDNYTQIFSDDIVVTGTEESQDQYGITDPMAREVDKSFRRMMVQFERAVTWGYRVSSIPATSATASRMGGFFYYTRVLTDGLSSDLAGDPVTMKWLDDRSEQIWQLGGNPTLLMMNSTGLREFQKFNAPYVQVQKDSESSKTAGFIVDHYRSAVGLEYDVVLNRHIGAGDFLFISPEQLGLGCLAGNSAPRNFECAEIPWQGGDKRQARILGEYTEEVKNHPTHHLWGYGGSTTVSV